MRYVKLQTTVTKILDETIDDINTVVSILESILKQELNCTLALSDGLKVSNVRITKMNENNFSFRVLSKTSSLIKQARYNEIEYLEINTNADVMCRNKPNVTRWTLLDGSQSE